MPQKIICRVQEIIHHGGQVYSVLLNPEGAAPRFKPGQFLHLALDDYSPGDYWPESRPFSIASSPQDLQQLRITYSAIGRFTTRMEVELAPGREVWVKMPYGEFTIQADHNICLLAGGTGITAFTGFLAGLPPDHPHRVLLFYGARCPELLIYNAIIDQAAQRCPKLEACFFVEQGWERGNFVPGRIDFEKVLNSCSNPLDFAFYMAGPPEMLKIAAAEFSKRKFPSELVHVDAWE